MEGQKEAAKNEPMKVHVKALSVHTVGSGIPTRRDVCRNGESGGPYQEITSCGCGFSQYNDGPSVTLNEEQLEEETDPRKKVN